MDLHKLQLLATVVDAGSYKKAGERLRLSHSAIHRQIKLLEQELGDRVLVRVARHVKLTKTGELLLGLASRVERDIAHTRIQIDELNHMGAGQLRIGTGTNMLIFFLAPILEQFRQRFPGVEVTVMTGTAEHVVRQMLADKLDVGVVYSPEDLTSEEAALEHERLYQDEFVLAIGKGHPLQGRHSVSLTEAVRYPFILNPPPSHLRRVFDRLFDTAGLKPRVVMELENEEAMEEMVGINMGVAFLLRRRAANDRTHHVRIRGQSICCDVGLVLPKADYLPAPIREFARMCRETAKGSRQ